MVCSPWPGLGTEASTERMAIGELLCAVVGHDAALQGLTLKIGPDLQTNQ